VIDFDSSEPPSHESMSPPLESTKSQQKISKKQEEGDIEDDDFDLKLPSEWVAGNEDWGSEDDRTEAIFNGSIAQPPDKDEFGLDDSDTSDDSTPSSPSPQSPDVFADDSSPIVVTSPLLLQSSSSPSPVPLQISADTCTGSAHDVCDLPNITGCPSVELDSGCIDFEDLKVTTLRPLSPNGPGRQ
jgi:hypothetical protein